jgi:hypothetical protein
MRSGQEAPHSFETDRWISRYLRFYAMQRSILIYISN